MSRRALKTDDEAGFLRAYRDEIIDTGEMYQVDVVCDIRVSARRVGLTLHMRASGRDGGPLEGDVVHAEYPYPSNTALRLHAALYQAAIRINVAVQQKYRDRHGHYLSDAV